MNAPIKHGGVTFAEASRNLARGMKQVNQAMAGSFAAFRAAMDAAARAARQAIFALARLHADPDAAARNRHGLGNQAADGTWQSDLCAAWVHDACPAGRLCDCTCHGGTVR